MMGRKLFSSLAFLFCSRYNLQRRHRTVLANGHRQECDTFFRMHWNCGRIILQSPSGRFLGIAPNSLLIANATIPGELSSLLPAYSTSEMLSRELGHIGMSTGMGGGGWGGQKIWVYILAESEFLPSFGQTTSLSHFQWRGYPICLPHRVSMRVGESHTSQRKEEYKNF